MKTKVVFSILFVMLALLCVSAFADTPTTVAPTPTTGSMVLTGDVSQCSIGMTVPVDTAITLTRGNDNIRGVGNVHVINNCNSKWTVSVYANNAYMYYELTTPTHTPSPTYQFLTTVMAVSTDGTTWKPFAPASTATGLVQTKSIELATGHGDTNIPVYVMQPVTTDDAGGKYTIKFTFTLEQ